MRFDSIRFVAERSLGVRARDSVLVGLPWSTKSRERERERERENEWNGATFSPFLYFSGEGGERETGGTHQKQNGGGAKDDDDDDDDDVRITDASFTFASPFLRPVLHFLLWPQTGSVLLSLEFLFRTAIDHRVGPGRSFFYSFTFAFVS